MQREAIRLRIRESRLRAGLSLLTPPLLVLMAWGGYLIDSAPAVTAALAILAGVLGWVVVIDFPFSIDIDDEGVRRNGLIRSQLIEWDQIDRIAKLRGRGVTAFTKSGKRLVLIDRGLDPSEVDLIETQARLRDVRTDL